MTKQGIYFRLLVELHHRRAPDAQGARHQLQDVLASLRNDIAHESGRSVQEVQESTEDAAYEPARDPELFQSKCHLNKHVFIAGECALCTAPAPDRLS